MDTAITNNKKSEQINTVLLSILIPTLPERKESFNNLINELYRQREQLGIQNEVEIIFNAIERGVITIGEKRNRLKSHANGKYIVGIDDDDLIAKNYLQLIMEGVRSGKDIITFDMDYYIDGLYNRTNVINRFIGNDWCSKYWAMNYNPTHRFTVNEIYYHLCPVKKELADQVSFIDANNMEDVTYSKELIPLIKTEFRIDHTLLHVFYNSKKTPNK